MSMNLHVQATLKARTKLGKKNIVESLGLWQTPTNVTRECIASGNPLDAYKSWIYRDCRQIIKEPVYAKDDIFGENDPASYRNYCPSDEHLEALDKWILDHEGWKIEWFEM